MPDPTIVINVMFIAFSTLFGIIIGSFLNVIIYRIPEGRTVVKGHSACMSCGHELKAIDLIPIFSWLSLRGKCRYCKAPVSSRYIKIESFTGLCFLIFAVTHVKYQLNLFDPTNKYSLAIFAFYCITITMFAALNASMMIYHDTSRSYYGFTVFFVVCAFINSLLLGVISGTEVLLRVFLQSSSMALVIVGIIAVFSRLLSKKYTSVDFWLDIPYAFFYTFYGKFVINSIFLLPSVVLLLILPRTIIKSSKFDKFSGILSTCGILLVTVIGYIISLI